MRELSEVCDVGGPDQLMTALPAVVTHHLRRGVCRYLDHARYHQLQQLRESYFDQRKKILKKTLEDVLQYLADGADKIKGRIDREAFERVETTLRNLKDRYGYCENCARDAVSYLLRKRYV